MRATGLSVVELLSFTLVTTTVGTEAKLKGLYGVIRAWRCQYLNLVLHWDVDFWQADIFRHTLSKYLITSHNLTNLVFAMSSLWFSILTCFTKAFPFSLHCENLTAASTLLFPCDSTVELFVTRDGWAGDSVAEPIASCAGVDWVVLDTPLTFNCGWWSWFVCSLAACVGVERVKEPFTTAWDAESSILDDGETGETFSFQLGPWRFSRCLVTLQNES